MATQHAAPPIYYPDQRQRYVFRIPRRRIRTTVVRLGGSAKRRSWCMKRIVVGFLRRLRLRLLALHYRQAIDKLRKIYLRLLKDLLKGAASLEILQAHTSLEYYFTAPFNPVSANGRT